MRAYQDVANDEMLAIGTIEHIDAVAHVEEIVSTPGLDVAVIGRGDLATSMGLKGHADHHDVQVVVERLEAAIVKSPAALGGAAPLPALIAPMIDRGYRFIGVGFDWSLLQRGIAAVMEGVPL